MTSPDLIQEGDNSKISASGIAYKLLAEANSHATIKGQPAEQGLISTTVEEAALVAEGFFHGAFENPINGAIQFSNHLVGTHLPEMHYVDAAKVENSLAGEIGTFAGDVLSIAAAAAVTGGCSSALRMGLLVAADAGIFQPSDAKSSTFFFDRGTRAAIGMAAGVGLGALGFTPTELGNVYQSVGFSPTGWAFTLALRALTVAVD